MAKGRRSNGEGSIYKRKDGRWTAQYIVDGQRKFILGKTQSEVKTKLREAFNDLENGIIVNNDLTLGEWMINWLEQYAKPSIRQSTYISYETYVRAHINPVIGQIKMKSLSVDTFQRFFNDKTKLGRLDGKGGLSSKTTKNLFMMIKTSMEQARENDLIKKNFLDSVKLPRVEQLEMRVLTIEEQQKLTKTVNESLEPSAFGINLALFTGVRLGELLGLKWENVDFENKRIFIKETVSRLKNFDESSINATTLQSKKSTKTQSSKRSIDLIDKLCEDLMAYKKIQDDVKIKFSSFNPEGFVFINKTGGILDPRTYQDIFKRHIKTAGVQDANFHSLRHTFATRAIEQGMDILVLSKILGHAQPSTTLNKYGHALPDHKRESMNKLCELYQSSTSQDTEEIEDDITCNFELSL
jgi:integrase